MSYLNQIQHSLDYVEEHLTEPLTVEDLASQVGFSPYHYYRIFGAYVGIPVMEYVRRRRLAHAAASLTSDRRILDIALDYGFQTHAGFTKAFVKVYGLAPERYRIHANGHPPRPIKLTRFKKYKFMGMETNSFNYYVGVEVSDFSGLDPQFQTTEIPAATYAVFTTPPTERSKLSDQIQSTWAYIYNEWFPNSAYEFAQGCADFELYDERCLRDTGCVIEIWIPIG